MIVDSLAGGAAPASGRRAHVAAIDGLRALSVLAVLLYHLDEALLPGGFVGVDVFFAISGFVVTRSLLDHPAPGFAAFLGRFYRRRVLRILPALFACLLVTGLLAMLLIPEGGLSRRNDWTGIAAVFGASNLALWWFAGDYFAPLTIYNPFTHTWSLGVEEQFYLVFPLLVFLFAGQNGPGQNGGRRLRQGGLLLLGLLGAGSLAWCAAASARDPQFAFYMLATRFWELGAGAGAALALHRLPRLRAAAAAAPPAAAAGLLLLGLLLLAAGFAAADAAAFPFPWALPPVAATALLCGLVTLVPAGGGLPGLPGRLLGSPPLAYLGRLSYSLYLWHFGIIVLFRWTVGIDTDAARAAAGLLGLGLAVASYHLVEQPLRTGPRLARLPDRAVLAGAAGAAVLTALLLGGLFLARPWLSLSVTRDRTVWALRAAPTAVIGGCRVERREEEVRGGTRISFLPAGCPPPERPRRLAVIGDSHAGAYQTLMQEVAGRQRIPVTVLQGFGCPAFRFWDAPGQQSPACRAFLAAATAEVAAGLGPGDVLFLPGLRVPRFRDQWDAPLAENARLDLAPTAADLDASAAAAAALAPLLARGTAVVVEAPKPVFRVAPFRCADRFTAVNPYCAPGARVDRAEIEARRVRPMLGIAAFAGQDPGGRGGVGTGVGTGVSGGVSIWDPLPILCPEVRCDAFRDGLPLFVDGDHLGPVGNRLLLPSFTAHLAALP